jgi:hypothetical protein
MKAAILMATALASLLPLPPAHIDRSGIAR